MSTQFSTRNTNTRTLRFLTRGASEAANSCDAPYHDDSTSMIKSNLYMMHKHYIKALTDIVRKQQDRAGSDNESITRYLKSLLMFDQKSPRSTGARDIMYHIHLANRLRKNEKKRLLRGIYESGFGSSGQPDRLMYMQDKVLLARGPCKFPKVRVPKYKFRDPTGSYKTAPDPSANPNPPNESFDSRYEFEPGKQEKRDINFPAGLHKLLEHAVNWGAYMAQYTDTSRNDTTNQRHNNGKKMAKK